MGDQDARRLESGFSFFRANDLQTLSTGQAICRVERADYDFNLETGLPREIDEEAAVASRTQIVAHSREKYASPREAIVQLLSEARQEIVPDQATRKTSKEDRATTEPVRPIQQQPEAIPPEPPAQSQPAAALPAPAPVTPGKGGREHKYLQQLIRQWGQGMGYLATVEKAVANGLIDVTLEKGSRSVACEITITTPIDKEIWNVRKCIEAGFTFVAVVVPDEKRLAKVEKAMRAALLPDELSKTNFVTPDSLFAILESLDAKDASKEETVRGYKVKVNYQAVDELAKADRSAVISKVIATARKKPFSK